jgi:NADP-dependent 3-hydroxy acid dehydrogenase YdfG
VTLQGHVALVTGASRGLGLAISRSLAAENVRVALLARAGAELDDAAKQVAAVSDAIAVRADVTQEGEVAAAVAEAVRHFGRLDIVVLNAGTWQGAPIQDTSEAQWDQLLDLNLKGSFLALKHAIPRLVARKGGTVVGIGSIGGWVGQANSAAYAASKWGLRGLLESAANELRPHGIRVSMVHPHNMNSAGKRIEAGSDERAYQLENADVASLVTWICGAPEHVQVGNATIWPRAAGIRSYELPGH